MLISGSPSLYSSLPSDILSPTASDSPYSNLFLQPSKTAMLCLGSLSLNRWSGKCLLAESQGNFKTCLTFLLSKILFLRACCLMSKNSCFIYFAQFSSCLQQEGNSYITLSWVKVEFGHSNIGFLPLFWDFTHSPLHGRIYDLTDWVWVLEPDRPRLKYWFWCSLVGQPWTCYLMSLNFCFFSYKISCKVVIGINWIHMYTQPFVGT